MYTSDLMHDFSFFFRGDVLKLSKSDPLFQWKSSQRIHWIWLTFLNLRCHKITRTIGSRWLTPLMSGNPIEPVGLLGLDDLCSRNITRSERIQITDWVVATQRFLIFSSYLENDPNLTNISQMGWNHQLAEAYLRIFSFRDGLCIWWLSPGRGFCIWLEMAGWWGLGLLACDSAEPMFVEETKSNYMWFFFVPVFFLFSWFQNYLIVKIHGTTPKR